MKEHVNRLARGDFEYVIPNISLSDSSLSGTVPCNTKSAGKFTVYSDARPVKGICYSSNERVTLRNSGFQGTENTISYVIDANNFLVDSVIEGKFDIITDAGELSLPYAFKVSYENMQTDNGNLSNLFHFANLVQTEPEMAKTVFLSKDFPRIFLAKDEQYIPLYKILRKSTDTMHAMEEFLISVKKKKAVSIKLDEKPRQYGLMTESVKDFIPVFKDGWGYLELDVAVDAPFIVPDKKHITNEDFAGNRYELGYVIDVKRLHAGRNYGRIVISNDRQQFTVEITAWEGIADVSVKLDMDKAGMDVIRRYIDFRTHKINYSEWLEESTDIVNRLVEYDENNYFARLLQAQAMILNKDEARAEETLVHLKQLIKESRDYDTLKAYYLYVCSLLESAATDGMSIVEKVEDLFKRNPDNWKIFWVLSHMDESYEQNKSMKLANIKSLFYKGCNSPVMYLEAINALNEQPYLLRVLDDFEIQVLSFGCRYDVIGDNLFGQICDLYESSKCKGMKVLKLLERLYAMRTQENVLELLSGLIIRMGTQDAIYREYLSESIAHGQRIARLYETYMEMRDEHDYSLLPTMVRLYFSYNNALDVRSKASLLANITVNKDVDYKTYESYHKMIREFAIEQIALGNISQNLAIIYKDIWDEDMLCNKYAVQLSRLLYTYRVTTTQSNLVRIYISHKELNQCVSVGIMDGTAYGLIYTDDCAVVFEDAKGRRYSGSVDCKMTRLLQDIDVDDKLYHIIDVKNHLFDVHLVQKAFDYNYNVMGLDAITLELYKNADLSENFKKRLAGIIARYYYESYTGNDFVNIYAQLKNAGICQDISVNEGVYLIETCISNCMYQDAKELVDRYGSDKIYPAKLLRLCMEMVDMYSHEELSWLVNMCHQTFVNRKYEDSILQYLLDFYNGSTQEMIVIWEAAKGFELECQMFEERLLAQMLFVQSTSTKMPAIFASYNSQGARRVMIESYLGYHSYNYFVRKVIPAEQIFQMIETRCAYLGDELLIEKIALIKYYSDMDELTDKQLIIAKHIIDELCSKKIVFGFYKKFAGRLIMPLQIIDKTYIEYRSTPDCRVTLHYMNEGEGGDGRFTVCEMPQMYDGVFVKDLTLFYGDTIQYYIVEKNGDREIVTESKCITNDKINPGFSEGRFECINDLLSCRELCDMVTLRKLMRSYSIKDYSSQQLFRPMG